MPLHTPAPVVPQATPFFPPAPSRQLRPFTKTILLSLFLCRKLTMTTNCPSKTAPQLPQPRQQQLQQLRAAVEKIAIATRRQVFSPYVLHPYLAPSRARKRPLGKCIRSTNILVHSVGVPRTEPRSVPTASARSSASETLSSSCVRPTTGRKPWPRHMSPCRPSTTPFVQALPHPRQAPPNLPVDAATAPWQRPPLPQPSRARVNLQAVIHRRLRRRLLSRQILNQLPVLPHPRRPVRKLGNGQVLRQCRRPPHSIILPLMAIMPPLRVAVATPCPWTWLAFPGRFNFQDGSPLATVCR